MPQLRELGAGLVRVYFYWSQVEPQPGRYSFDTVDAFLDQLDGSEEVWVTICPDRGGRPGSPPIPFDWPWRTAKAVDALGQAQPAEVLDRRVQLAASLTLLLVNPTDRPWSPMAELQPPKRPTRAAMTGRVSGWWTPGATGDHCGCSGAAEAAQPP